MFLGLKILTKRNLLQKTKSNMKRTSRNEEKGESQRGIYGKEEGKNLAKTRRNIAESDFCFFSSKGLLLRGLLQPKEELNFVFDCGPQSPARVALIESKPCTANAQLSLASAAAAAAAYRTSPLTHDVVVVVVDVDIKLFFLQ